VWVLGSVRAARGASSPVTAAAASPPAGEAAPARRRRHQLMAAVRSSLNEPDRGCSEVSVSQVASGWEKNIAVEW
jgi:hypothetical protein